MTLEDAKKWLRGKLDVGARCPCCNQHAKMYEKRISSRMAKCLIELYKQSNTWVRRESIKNHDGSGEFAKLNYWGFIVERPNSDTKKKNSGWWKITASGIDFVEGRTRAQKYAKIYDGDFYGFAGEFVTISDALGMHFDYRQTMSPAESYNASTDFKHG